MDDSTETIERAFSVEKLKLAFICTSESHMRLIRFYIDSVLHAIGDDSHFEEIAYNMFELYNGSLIYIVRPDQCWKLSVDYAFIFDSKDGKSSAVRSCINNIKDLHLV